MRRVDGADRDTAARLALRLLVDTYARDVDRRDTDAVAALFTADGRLVAHFYTGPDGSPNVRTGRRRDRRRPGGGTRALPRDHPRGGRPGRRRSTGTAPPGRRCAWPITSTTATASAACSSWPSATRTTTCARPGRGASPSASSGSTGATTAPWPSVDERARSAAPGRSRDVTTIKMAALPPVRSGVCADPDWMAGFCRTSRPSGFESVVVVEHPLVIGDYTSRYPYAPSGRMPLPDDCAIPDPIDLLAFLAGVTSTLGLATGRARPARPPSRDHGQAPGHGGPAVEGSGAVVHRGGLDARGARGVRGGLRQPGTAHRRVHRRDARPVGRHRARRSVLRR